MSGTHQHHLRRGKYMEVTPREAVYTHETSGLLRHDAKEMYPPIVFRTESGPCRQSMKKPDYVVHRFYLRIYVHVYLSVCLSVCLLVYLSTNVFVKKSVKAVFDLDATTGSQRCHRGLLNTIVSAGLISAPSTPCSV